MISGDGDLEEVVANDSLPADGVRDTPSKDNIRGPFLTSPLGLNFDPRGEVVPQG
jgi:hypothetical protein